MLIAGIVVGSVVAGRVFGPVLHKFLMKKNVEGILKTWR